MLPSPTTFAASERGLLYLREWTEVAPGFIAHGSRHIYFQSDSYHS